MTQRLIYNVTGQTLRHVPSSLQATIAWVLEDLRYDVDSTARELDSGTAAVDTATEATTAAAGPGQANPRLMTVASTTGFAVSTPRVPSWYEIVGTGGSEFFKLSGLATDASLTSELPLIGTYASGATVRGVVCTTAAIDVAVLQDEQRVQQDLPMRVVWTYADGTRHQEQVRLVREDAADLFATAIEADVRDLFPDLDTRMTYHGRNVLSPFVRSVIRQIRADALEKNIRIEELLTGEQGHWCAVYRTLKHLDALGNRPASEDQGAAWKKYVADEYEKRWNGLTIGTTGAETMELERVSATAATSDGNTYRSPFAEM